MKLYLVMAEAGSYSDARHWPVRIFALEKSAQAFAARCAEEAERLTQWTCPECDGQLYEHTMFPEDCECEAPGNSLDPQMPAYVCYPGDGVDYHVHEVELDDA